MNLFLVHVPLFTFAMLWFLKGVRPSRCGFRRSHVFLWQKHNLLEYYIVYTPNSKMVVFWIVALCIAHCCIPRPQRTMDGTNFYIVACQDRKALWSTLLLFLMSLSHSRHLQCYLKIRFIHGALRSGYATMRNAQCNNSEDNLFLN